MSKHRDYTAEGKARAATAAPVKERDWVDTGAHDLIEEDEHTPVAVAIPTLGDIAKLEVEATQRVRARVKETNTDVKAVARTATLTNMTVDTLRTENNQRFDKVETSIAHVDSKVDILGGHVMTLVGSQGKLTGQVGELVKRIDRDNTREDIDFEVKAHVGKAEAIAEVKDKGAEKQQKRELFYATWKKTIQVVLAILGAGATVLITHFVEHC
jgi:hypothetical protein